MMDSAKYILRSKDRISGNTNDFTVNFPTFISQQTNECYVKILSANFTPVPIDKPPGSGYSFDAKSYLDVCFKGINYKQLTDICRGQAEKLSQDDTAFIVPIVTGGGSATLNNNANEWLKIANPGGLSTFGVRIFNDSGLLLQSRSTTTYGTLATKAFTGADAVYSSGQTLTITLGVATTTLFRGDIVTLTKTTGGALIYSGSVVVISVVGTVVVLGLNAGYTLTEKVDSTSYTMTWLPNAGSPAILPSIGDCEIEMLVSTKEPTFGRLI